MGSTLRDTNLHDVSAACRAARARRDHTQEEAAREVGMARWWWGKMERGGTTIPPDVLPKLLAYLGDDYDPMSEQ